MLQKIPCADMDIMRNSDHQRDRISVILLAAIQSWHMQARTRKSRAPAERDRPFIHIRGLRPLAGVCGAAPRIALTAARPPLGQGLCFNINTGPRGLRAVRQRC